ncbi:hypothetical protein [Natranaerobius thermophilus]|uniref:Uncharacterized protein n=1 Tax=Natranaerobius thermophilus (strain ATCC BAA-1301 / DSM 18059 / JW/NM-WN-LF) TaxID=457570 RepID=B2A3R0_NATTJ|nr:hypothetical protein [Natranaerobius thermophilus]ACB83686.1 hypothetical protein Nther_0087 [Natranaerobius thermophilus JW/NM-WN-LF]
MSLIGLSLFAATCIGMLTYSLAFTESLISAIFLLLAVIGFYYSIREHAEELMGENTETTQGRGQQMERPNLTEREGAK